MGVLEDHADVLGPEGGQLRLAQLDELLPEHTHLAARSITAAGEKVQQPWLARARGAGDWDSLARVDGQIDVVQSTDALRATRILSASADELDCRFRQSSQTSVRPADHVYRPAAAQGWPCHCRRELMTATYLLRRARISTRVTLIYSGLLPLVRGSGRRNMTTLETALTGTAPKCRESCDSAGLSPTR